MTEIDGKALEAALETIRALQARIRELEEERDELDALLNEGGSWEQQLSKAEARAEAAEKALMAIIALAEPACGFGTIPEIEKIARGALRTTDKQ